jgi:hypothetical protein
LVFYQILECALIFFYTLRSQREKTSQAFRDALSDQYKSSNITKKKVRLASLSLKRQKNLAAPCSRILLQASQRCSKTTSNANTSGKPKFAVSPKSAPSNLDFEIPSTFEFDLQSAMPSHQGPLDLGPNTVRNELRDGTIRPGVNFTFPSSCEQETCHQLNACAKLQTNAIESGSLVSCVFQQQNTQPQMSYASPVALPIALCNPNLLWAPFFETLAWDIEFHR